MKYLLFFCVFLFYSFNLHAAEIVTADDFDVGRLGSCRGHLVLWSNLKSCDELMKKYRLHSRLPINQVEVLNMTAWDTYAYLSIKKKMRVFIESFSEDVLVQNYIQHLFLENITALDEFKKAHPDFNLNCEKGVAWYLVLRLERYLSYLWLLENEADPNVIVDGLIVNDHHGERELRKLVIEDVCNKEEYLLPLLQRHPYLKGYVNDAGETLFHMIRNQASHLIPTLTLMGCDKEILEYKDSDGLTPLASAVYRRQYNVALQFLWMGADRNCLFEKHPNGGFLVGDLTPIEHLERAYKLDSEYLAAPDRHLGQLAQAQMRVELEQMRNLIEYIRLLEKQEKTGIDFKPAIPQESTE